MKLVEVDNWLPADWKNWEFSAYLHFHHQAIFCKIL